MQTLKELFVATLLLLGAAYVVVGSGVLAWKMWSVVIKALAQ